MQKMHIQRDKQTDRQTDRQKEHPIFSAARSTSLVVSLVSGQVVDHQHRAKTVSDRSIPNPYQFLSYAYALQRSAAAAASYRARGWLQVQQG